MLNRRAFIAGLMASTGLVRANSVLAAYVPETFTFTPAASPAMVAGKYYLHMVTCDSNGNMSDEVIVSEF